MIGDQLSLPVLHESLIDELRARRATKAIVGANAIVTLRRMQRAGEKVSRRSWNQAWALLEAAVPPLPPELHPAEATGPNGYDWWQQLLRAHLGAGANAKSEGAEPKAKLPLD